MIDDSHTLNLLRRRAVILCILTTVVIATVQLLIGWRFRLISIFAEGLHTAADLLDSLVAFVLVAVASKPADRDHPYGHGKFDSLAGLIEGGFVGASAVWALVMASLVLLGAREADPRPEPITLIAMAAASGIYLVVSNYVLKLAERTRSPVVYAEAMHLRTHVYITIGLLCGLALTHAGLRLGWAHANRLDAMAALVLGTYLLTIAARIIRPAYQQLMDRALPADELQRIVDCLNEFQGRFVEVHAMRTRQAGTDRHVDIHLMVTGEMTVRASHDLSHDIEQRLRECLPGARLLVHIEPAVGDALRAYEARNRTGAVFASQPDPLEREPGHHDHARAHQG